MARIRHTARKRVRAIQAAHRMAVAAPQAFAAEEADNFETQHDEALLATEDDPVDDPMEDLDEDPEEDTKDPDEDPEEDPTIVLDFPTSPVLSLDEDTTDNDDSTKGDQIVPDVATTEDDETSEDSASRGGIRMYPLPTMRALTPPVPPLIPLPSDNDYDLAPEGYEEDQAMTDPDTPPPSPTGVPTVIHDWMIGRLTTDLAAAEARADELKRQLAVERETRRSYQDERRLMTPRGKKRKFGSQGRSSVNKSFPARPLRGTRSQPLRNSGFRKTENTSLRQGGSQTRVSHFNQPRPPLPKCKTCGRKHLGECTLKSVICFKCNKTGHYARTCPLEENQKCFRCGNLGHLKRDCPMANPAGSRISGAASNQPPTARTFNMAVEDAVRDTNVIADTLLLNTVNANVLFDSGVAKSFISRDFASQLRLRAEPLKEVLEVEIANREVIPVDKIH
ncbi:hypothetical protein POM88_025919 [Heracleum sosnowskyi]|uniref:CCHC-type domain-containing protein n=1 Tax=Heracleum sosnowskyi TaxID=360622 RepID=A0AAD8I5W4_9APIA|nr:hypothetical protein POM88_025919 [Heracleum sosnowskyi]